MMNVYLFKDYLASIHGEKLDESKAVAKIEPIKNLPSGLVRIDGRLARVCCLSNPAIYIAWIEEPKAEDECLFEFDAKCPHCGYKHSDSWEFADEDEQECSMCGTVFSVVRNVEVTYSTKVIARNDAIQDLN